MQIFRYKANSPTGFEIVPVDDNYQLQAGELRELPNPCYTPMVLDDNGILVSNTLEASNVYARAHTDIKVSPSATQQQISNLTLTVGKLSQQITGLTSLVQAQQQTIAKLKGGN